MSFTHLQVRSGYSLMNSTITIDKLVKKASERQFNAIALTDDHVLYGVIPFYKACTAYGIKPIIGMVVHLSDEDTNNETCILLAKNNTGYDQLVKLSTHIHINNIDAIGREELSRYTSNLIGIFPAYNQTIESSLLSDDHNKVYEYSIRWKEMFADNDFYIGIQDHGLVNDGKIQESLKSFHDHYQIPVVAINDVRYVNENDDIAFDCLTAMKEGKRWTLDQKNSSVKHRHLRSIDEMNKLFHSFWPAVIEETQRIQEKCAITFDFNERMLPSYPVPEHMDAHEYLEKMCWSKIEQIDTKITKEVSDRLKYELDVIKSMQFSDYFLIVWDFIQYAKDNSILVGPGRGSAAGSLVAYVLGITEVDPIKFDLLFERFLNPERITMPDIDIDFSDHRRDEVIEYVRDKYGQEHVAQIITFGTFATRSVLRELIKTMGINKQDANFILKEIPVQAHKSIVEYVRESNELKEYIIQSETLKTLFAVATKLEGLPRHVSTHAAGVVISDKPLVDHVPLTIGTNETNLTQFSMNDLEAIGLLKIDFLGLRNLTLQEKIMKTIGFTTGKKLLLKDIPKNDVKTFDLLQKGKTNGVFQLESQGMKQVLTRLKPTSLEDIVAVNALYRPGPMEYIPTYIARKHGREKVTYPHPDLAPILERTYGVLVYQEQIMQIANKFAGFSLGKADILRRAVSKKLEGVMDEQREAFIQGCLKRGYNQQVADEIFTWIVKFSNYGFNRSHAVAYSMISYQLAYLKAHYPVCFFAELMSSFINQQEKIQLYIKEAKELDITVYPPSINKSFGKFSVENNAIRMGLLSIKGIGNQVVKEIIKVRKAGPFKNIFNFCLRVSLKIINRPVLENLIMAGAFDDTFTNRASLLASIDQAIEQGELFREFTDQQSFFQDQLDIEANYVDIADFSLMKKLVDEKELLGIYVSSHPLRSYRTSLEQNGFITMLDARKNVGQRNNKSAVIIQSIKNIRTKRGDPMAFVTIGDETDDMEAVIFPELYRESHRFLSEETIVLVKGKIESRNNRIQWLLSEISIFDEKEWEQSQNRRLFIKVTEQKSEHALNNVKHIKDDYPGSTSIIMYYEVTKKTYQLSSDFLINPNQSCLQVLRKLFGEKNVVLEK
ncbi:DNA polymerase III subunit alpha [Virgibacillus ndiopensis]|uniref:DNA polymerase III subunit alpha n=1 Tax=Virgibacillus ndiopensis TaxID=2004408 RepID=UPI000C07993F|nr:DNA polymerase III subunit alpha [Virgibacillus ndiopensis]